MREETACVEKSREGKGYSSELDESWLGGGVEEEEGREGDRARVRSKDENAGNNDNDTKRRE